MQLPLHLPTVSEFIYAVGMAAVAVNAASGALESGEKRMDIVGVCVVALATALGGGTVRDLLLARPVFWIADPLYLLTAFSVAIIFFVLVRAVALPARLFLIPDAIGLALFTVAGTQIALDMQVAWPVAVLMGLVTATFGGVARDVLCNDIPLIFLPSELYASAAFAGTLLYVGLQALGVSDINCGWAAMAAVFGLRMLSVHLNIGLPAFKRR